MAKHQYGDHEIEVRSYTVGKCLWLAFGFEVYVDGVLVARSLDKIEGPRARLPFPVGTSTGIITPCLFTSTFRIRYEIEIDGRFKEKGAAVPQNWYGGIIIMAIIIDLVHILVWLI